MVLWPIWSGLVWSGLYIEQFISLESYLRGMDWMDGSIYPRLASVAKKGEMIKSSFKYEEKDITIQEILLVTGYLQLDSLSQLDSVRGECPPPPLKVRQRKTKDSSAEMLEY